MCVGDRWLGIEREVLVVPGTELSGRYVLEELLGSGGMGDVWRAADRELRRRVAVKVMREQLSTPDAVTRFKREAWITAGLSHPAITVVYDAGAQDGKPFIVMEYLDGRDLADVLAERRGGLPVDEAVSLVIQAADALQAAHEGGVIHRDLKPRNLFLQRSGVLKLCDFGIAWTAALTAGLTMPGTVLGTACYMAPELWEGQSADERSDLYSVGCVLYELLTGLPPFTGDTLTAIMGQHMNIPPTPPREHRADIPLELDQLVVRLLAKDPASRPGSAAQVSAILRGIAPGTAPPTGTATRLAGESPRTPTEPAVTPSAPGAVKSTQAAAPTQDLVTDGQRRGRPFSRAGEASDGPTRVASLTGLPRVDRMALSADGSRLAVQAARTIMMWDVTNPSRPIQAGTHVQLPADLNDMALSPDGDVLAVSRTHTVTLRQYQGLDMSHPTSARINDVAGPIKFSADGGLLAVSGNRSVALWNIAPRGRRGRIDLTRVPTISAIHAVLPDAVAFSPSRRTLALSEMRKKQVSAPQRYQTLAEKFASMDPNARAVDKSQFQQRSQVTGFDPGPVALWDISNLTVPVRIAEVPVNAVVRKLHFLSEDRILVIADQPAFSVWDISDLAYPPRLIASHQGDPAGTLGEIVAFSPSRCLVATGSSPSGSVLLWDIADPANPVSMPGPTGLHTSAPLALSADGLTLATTGGVPGSVILWLLPD
jgi:tRNA A-37 threonylcarbamoyl transferase component Bud32